MTPFGRIRRFLHSRKLSRRFLRSRRFPRLCRNLLHKEPCVRPRSIDFHGQLRFLKRQIPGIIDVDFGSLEESDHKGVDIIFKASLIQKNPDLSDCVHHIVPLI